MPAEIQPRPVLRPVTEVLAVVLAALVCFVHAADAAPGDTDPTFNSSAAGGFVDALATQPDGKILLGGGFANVNATARPSIARVNADGSLDRSFNQKTDGAVWCAAVQSDGKILLGGNFGTVGGVGRAGMARLNSDGSLDPNFNPSANSGVTCVALQADGNMVVGGWFTTIGGTNRNHIARINPDGSPDLGFNPNANNDLISMTLQPDGKILLGGKFTTVGGATHNHMARLNADGSIDSSFNPDVNGIVYCMAAQPDGKILLAGGFTTVWGTARNGAARLNADGSLDVSFDPNPGGYIYALTLQVDGKILMPGYTNGSYALLRINADGSREASFTNQIVNGTIEAVTMQADGRILVGGNILTVGGNYYISNCTNIVRLLNGAAGQTLSRPDNTQVLWQRQGTAPEVERGTFELMSGSSGDWTTLGSGSRISGGWQLTGLGLPANGFVRARGRAAGSLLEQVLAMGSVPNITIWQAGSVLSNGISTVSFGSLLPEQAAAPRTFVVSNSGSANLVLGTLNTAGDAMSDYVVDTTGMTPTLAPGATTSFIVTFNPSAETLRSAVVMVPSNDGTKPLFTVLLSGTRLRVEPSFDPNANANVVAVVAQPDGKILVGGQFTALGGTTRNYVARLNADGSLDTGFNPNANGNVYNFVPQPDGKILLGGQFTTLGATTRNRLARLNADGSLEAGFNPNLNGTVYSLVVQPDGKILLAGGFTTVGATTRNRVARLNADGSLDTGFNPDVNNVIYSLALQPDGKILLGGVLSTVGGTARSRIARINADGSLDTGFNPGASGNVYSLVVQADGRILLGGSFTSVGGTARTAVARLNADGSLDNNFNPNATSYVESIALQSDGKILIAGYFTSIGGTTRDRLARLNADGSLDASFNPDANSDVLGVAVQGDGKILTGGMFTSFAGGTRNYIARLNNGAASQTLYAASASQVQWLRGGTAAEVGQVTFELSTNGGSTWTPLGSGTRITGGWTQTGLNLPGTGQIRARGRASGGYYSGSSSLIEQVQAFDIVPPALTCPSNVMVNLEAGQSYASGVALGTPLASDNSGSVTLTSNAPAQFPAGTNVVTWTATDPSGNSNTCAQLVMVIARDTQPPALTCPSPISVGTDPGQCYATGVALGTPVASDNSGSATVTSNAPAQFPVGTNVVTWTATDPSGNSNTCAQLVIVRDPENPQIRCSSNLLFSTDVGQCSKSNVIFYASASDNCMQVNLTCTPPSGSTFAVGTNGVLCTATDASGNTAHCAFLVAVADQTPPSVTCPTNQVLNTDPGTASRSNVTFTATATDNCAVTNVACVPPSGSTFPVGTNLVNCTATDSSGNSVACRFQVVVLDVLIATAGEVLNLRIPDGSPVGLANSVIISTPIERITEMTVTLNVTSGFNGDLLAYLVHDSGHAVLLNRPGKTLANPFGYGDAGFNVTFDDTATNGDIHNYRLTLSDNPNTPLPGALTNAWVPDGRDTDPALVLDTAPRPATLSAFTGLNPNGRWTLFVADVDALYASTLVSWGLQILGTNAPPLITAPPQSRTNVLTTEAVFSVAASGLSAMSYLWFFNGTTMANATNATLHLPNIQTTNAGSYAVRVTTLGGSVMSEPATLIVIDQTVNGVVQMEFYAGLAGDGTGNRPVALKGTDATNGPLATWNLPLNFTNSTASFTLAHAPLGLAHLSAKTAWHLRRRLPVVFTNGVAPVNFTSVYALRAGDLDDSNTVDFGDYFILAGAWYTPNAAADLDGNGWVDWEDYFLLAEHWLQTGDTE